MIIHDLSDDDGDIDRRLLHENFQSLAKAINKVRIQVTTPATPGEEFSAKHGLTLVPTGVQKVGSSAPVTVYDGSTPNDQTYIYLKADVGGVTVTLDITGGDITVL